MGMSTKAANVTRFFIRVKSIQLSETMRVDYLPLPFSSMKSCQTVIIGAGPAGLACAAALHRKGLECIVLEKGKNIASTWRKHYDRLHLHTHKGSSGLPYMGMPLHFPRYPSRDNVVEYLEAYAIHHRIEPVFKTKVDSVTRQGNVWNINTKHGEAYQACHVIFCTGNARKPNWVSKPGMESFTGDLIHSSQYKNGQKFEGGDVLVMGFGNSACEIAICLHEHGARPSMLVRSPVNVIPRDVLGIPALSVGVLTSGLSPRMADRLNKPIIQMTVGDITKLGLRKPAYGPVEQIVTHHKIPLLDIGTLDLIRKGVITIYPDLVEVRNRTVEFIDGRVAKFDAIIMATGYRSALEDMIEISLERSEDIQRPIKKRSMMGDRNAYFCGFYVSPTGMLREIKQEAIAIARHIASQPQKGEAPVKES